MDMNKLSENVKEHWNAWELRTLVLLSLLLQILLVIFGNRRKYMAGRSLGVFVWLAYLSADWVAIFTLGVLARSQGTVLASSQGEGGKNSTNLKFIPLFWAPALLAHLGGPDTITAYAMQDNDFGIRRLLEAITQVVIVIYVLIKLWSKDNLPFVAILIFLVGLYKYGERILVLRSASSKKFRASAIKELDKRQRPIDDISEPKFLFDAHTLFRLFKGLLSNLLLDHSHVRASRRIISFHAGHSPPTFFPRQRSGEIFKLIEVELGFAYDALYTKITGAHGGRIFLRFISFLLTTSALVVFSTTVDKQDFSRIDIVISYVLLVGAVVLDIISIVMFRSSDWIRKQKNEAFSKNDKKRWSGLMAQHDLLIAFQSREKCWDKCLEAMVDKGAKIQGRQEVSVDLKQLIFNRLLQGSATNNIRSVDGLRTELEKRGREVLEGKNCFEEFGWSVVDLEFGQSLLVWHIATSLCYWDEFHKNREPGSALDPRCIISQSLSNYMMYLLVEYPSMLPKGIYEPGYRETKSGLYQCYVPIKSRFMSHPPPLDLGNLYRRIILLREENAFPLLVEPIVEPINEDIVPPESEDIVQPIDEDIVKNLREATSSLSGGRELVRRLHGKKFESSGEKWKMISEVWVEMLIYAAGQCEWKEHAQALTRGGELITLVSLLKAHLGLTLQRRAKEFDQSPLDNEFDSWLDKTLGHHAVGTGGLRNDGSPSFPEVRSEHV